ncbi:hypothetical protein GCM10007972_24840 [Iodidimonas muriae]|uniref:Uncharacterized protein n=1 Tax=Iodidimonas muriae TaxID=261467 RepID=A0ABQ2LGD9_9PROT|nr:hypothetical protein [Iodidimonas muriae]GGO16133.1 hypothetical protein GCM10007972_24840 [Iodidimonas muriae]
MIRLDLKREPWWLDLGHGVRVHVRPCTTALVMAARAAMARGADPGIADASMDIPTDLSAEASAKADALAKAGERTAAFVKALACLAVDDWEGVGDAKGKPAKVTPEGVAALMDLWPLAEAFERQYLGPALLLDAEKNA